VTRRLLIGALLVGVVVIAVQMYPDAARYLKMRAM
jgi:hypothetical protein